MIEESAETYTRPTLPRVADMDKNDTPRERAIKYGCEVLSLAELWALILRTGTVGNPITELCRDLMRRNDDSLVTLQKRTRQELLALKGLGSLKALQIEAVMEIVRRYNLEGVSDNPVVKTSADAAALMKPKIGALPHEEIWVIILNRRNQVIKTTQITKGGISASVFDIRLVIKTALLENASAIMLVHNHPSGNLLPSPQDDQITRRCKEAAAVMDIRLLDHIIVTSSSYYSYADEGRL